MEFLCLIFWLEYMFYLLRILTTFFSFDTFLPISNSRALEKNRDYDFHGEIVYKKCEKQIIFKEKYNFFLF